MNLRECYSAMGADYDDILRRLVSEERIIRFLRMLARDQSFVTLKNALAAEHYEEAFRASHSLKGICMNMGLTRLMESSSALTENLRSGQAGKDTAALFEALEQDYHTAIEAIESWIDDGSGANEGSVGDWINNMPY